MGMAVDRNKRSTRIVKSKIFNLSWIVNSMGKRISPRFILWKKEIEGTFVKVTTRNKDIIFNRNSDDIVFMIKAGHDVFLNKLTEDLYEIELFYLSNGSCTGRKEILYDKNGKLISDAYSSIKRPACGRIAVLLNGKWGFIDEKGTCVIPPTWESVKSFNEYGYSVVTFKDYNKIAVIDVNSTYVLGPQPYSSGLFISENLLIVTRNGRRGVIDLEGNIIVSPEYDYIEKNGNHFIVKRGQKYGLFEINGACIFECIYPEIIETPDKFVVQDFAKQEALKTVEVSK